VGKKRGRPGSWAKEFGEQQEGTDMDSRGPGSTLWRIHLNPLSSLTEEEGRALKIAES
jgi:hypothetical protein